MVIAKTSQPAQEVPDQSDDDSQRCSRVDAIASTPRARAEPRAATKGLEEGDLHADSQELQAQGHRSLLSSIIKRFKRSETTSEQCEANR